MSADRLCKDCKYYHKRKVLATAPGAGSDSYKTEVSCASPDLGTDPICGNKIEMVYVEFARYTPFLCGPEGRFWEARS